MSAKIELTRAGKALIDILIGIFGIKKVIELKLNMLVLANYSM